MRRLAPLSLLALSSGCSLLVGATPPECTDNADCAILNELAGIAPDACTLYQCSTMSRSCELSIRDQDGDGLVAPECAEPGQAADCDDGFPTGPEVCNGIDDDCDGMIDEGVAASPPENLLGLGGLGRVGHVGYGAGGGALALAHASGMSATFGLLDGESRVGPTALHVARAEDLTSTTASALVAGCHQRSASGGVQAGTCELFRDVGLGLGADVVLSATVITDGCAQGQLRVGLIERGDAAAGELIERGPLHRSNAFLGIDTDPTATGATQCTGASRASGTLGAARPGVAVLADARGDDQALVAYLADTVERPACGGTAVDVEVLGLFVQEDTFGSTYRWVTASGEGQPQVVGQTTGGGVPAVAPWSGTGYLVAFGAGSAIQLVFVEQPAPLAPYDRSGAADDRSGIETPPLVFHDLGTIPAGGPADDVVLAAGSVRTRGIDFGVAWREGCGTGAESIHFRRLRVGTDGTLDLGASSEAIELAATSAAGPPSIAYRFAGLLEPGAVRPDGRPTADETSDGGWVVAWEDASMQDPGPADDRRILAARVSELDGEPLGDPIVLSAPGDRERQRPMLFRTPDDEVRYVFLELGGEMDGFRGGTLSCLPPARM